MLLSGWIVETASAATLQDGCSGCAYINALGHEAASRAFVFMDTSHPVDVCCLRVREYFLCHVLQWAFEFDDWHISDGRPRNQQAAQYFKFQ